MRITSLAICLVTLILGSGCQSGTSGFRNPFRNPFVRSVPENSAGLVAKSKVDTQAEKPNVFDLAQQEAASQPEPAAVASVKPIPDTMGKSDRELKKPLSQSEKLLSQGDQAFDASLLAKAAAFYDEVVRIDPRNVHAHHRLAMIADMQKNYSLAETHYTAALKVDPNNMNLLNDLGYSYYLQQNFDESQAYLSYVLQMDPSNTLAMKNLGLVLAAQGNTQEAYALLQQGGLNPGESQQKIQQAVALANSGSANRNSVGNVSLNTVNPGSQRIQPTAGEYNVGNSNTNSANFGQSNPSMNQFGTGRQALDSNYYEPNFQQGTGDTYRAPVPTRTEKVANPGNQDYSQYGSDRQQQPAQGPRDYLLERAALNTGFGNLFPITSSEEYHRAQQARPVSWEPAGTESADARRAYYEQFGDPQHGTQNVHNAHHSRTANSESQIFYGTPQTPIHQTSTQSQNSGPQSGMRVPVTQPSFSPQTPVNYDQFPRSPRESGTENPPRNALREYQEGLQEFQPSPFSQPQYR